MSLGVRPEPSLPSIPPMHDRPKRAAYGLPDHRSQALVFVADCWQVLRLDSQTSGWYAAIVKVTIAFQDDEIYRRVKLHAAASGRQVRDIVEEALTAWLDAQEDADDRQVSAAALEEYAIAGGVDADAYFARLVAEGHVSYDPD